MFLVIYHFEVYPDKKDQFIKAWADLTKLIYQYEGSLGSRLHFKENNLYVAYAQWPSKEVWDNSGGKLPESSIEIKAKMKDACSSISTEYQMEMVADLLKSKTHD